MDDALLLQLIDHLDGQPDDVIDLALAAVEGDQQLEAAIDGQPEPRPATPEAEPEVEPVGAFIRSLSVAGFRGIGPQTKITFQPGPGLTVVSGRNGSGKSSLAEALEFALTQSTHRWQQPNSDFTQVWRNVHHGDPCEIALELDEQEVGRSVIKASWAPDADRAAAQLTYQRSGEKQQIGLAGLGWERPLRLYRPILSYEELGRMLTGRGADLFDALNTVLGLDDLNEAFARLKLHSSPLSRPVKLADVERQALRKLGNELSDARGSAAGTLLSARRTPSWLASERSPPEPNRPQNCRRTDRSTRSSCRTSPRFTERRTTSRLRSGPSPSSRRRRRA